METLNFLIEFMAEKDSCRDSHVVGVWVGFRVVGARVGLSVSGDTVGASVVGAIVGVSLVGELVGEPVGPAKITKIKTKKTNQKERHLGNDRRQRAKRDC